MNKTVIYKTPAVLCSIKYCRKLHVFFLLIVLTCALQAQQQGLVIIDKISRQPVEYAHVQVRYLSGNISDNTISNVNGEVDLKNNFPVVITISSLNYKPYNDTLSGPDKDTILLSPEYYQLDNIVVTGQYRPQAVDKSIYKINVIDNRQIRLKAAENMNDLLKTDLSIQTRQEGVLGQFMRVRGLSGEYVKILIDGMPVTGRVLDGIDLGQLNLSNVDHIEVIEGPTSVVYGSNALAGVINIITGDISQKSLISKTSAYYETVGTYNFNTLFSKRIKNQVFSLNAGRNFQSGWGPDEDSRYKIWKPKEQYLLNGGYYYNKNFLLIKFSTDYLNEELRDLQPPAVDGKALDSYHFTTRWNNSLNLSKQYSDDFVLNLQAGYSYYRKRKISYNNDLVTLTKVEAPDPDLHDTTTFNLTTFRGFVSNIPGRKLEYQTGFDLSNEWTNSNRTDGLKTIADIAGFMSIIYRPVQIIRLQPGIRFIYNSKYHAPVVYSVNLIFEPANFKFRASYAKGFTAPSLKQLYLEFIDNNHHIFGNEDLKSETADNISLSADYNFKKSKYAVDLGINTFYNSLTNAIQLAIDPLNPGFGKYFNIESGHFITKGIETRLNFHLFPRLTIGAGTSTTGRSHFDDMSKFAYSTDIVSSMVYHSPKYNYEVAAFYKYSDNYHDFAGTFDSDGILSGVSESTMEDYHTLDLTVSKPIWKDRITVACGVKNIFNVTLVNSTGSLNPHSGGSDFMPAGYGRTFYLKLVFQFDKY